MGQDIVSQIVRRFNPVISRRKGLVLAVCGAPGIGKTWTVNQVMQSLTCRHVSVVATIDLTTFFDALPQSAKFPNWVLIQLKKLKSGEFIESRTLQNTLSAVLAGLAPFVLHLEDVHETTSERFELICSLAQSILRIKGVGLIVSSRVPLSAPFEQFQIFALSKIESDHLLMVELGSNLPVQACEYIYEQAQGNPLFSLEFLRYLTRQGFLYSDGKNWHWRVPPIDFMPASLEALLERITNQSDLDQATRDTLEARAVLQVPIQLVDPTWQVISGLDKKTFEQAKQKLILLGIIVGQDFVHRLMQEVYIHAIPISRLRVIAKCCFEYFRETNPVLATDFMQQAGLEPKLALSQLQQAISISVQPEIIARLLALKVHWTAPKHRFEAAIKAAWALIELDLKSSVSFAELAFSLEPSQPKALYLMTQIRLMEHRFEEVKELLDQFPVDKKSTKRHWQYSIQYAKESSALRQAIRIWHQKPKFHNTADPITIHSLSWSIMETAFPEEIKYAKALISKTLSHSQLSLQDQYLLLDAHGNLTMRLGEYEQATNDFVQALEFANQAKSYAWQAKLCTNLAHVHYVQDQNQAAIAYIELAHKITLEHGMPFDLALVQSRLALVFLEKAEFEKAEGLMQKSHDFFQGSNTPELQEVNLQLATLYFSWNTAHSAVLATWYARNGLKVARVLALPYPLGLALFRSILTELKFGEFEIALKLLTEFEQTVLELPLVGLQARLDWVSGLVWETKKDLQKAIVHLTKAGDLFASLEDTSLVHQVQLELDRITLNRTRALERLDWFRLHNLERLGQLVLHYFPNELTEPIITPVMNNTLRLNVLGSIQLEQHGSIIKYRGRKRLELLIYLLETRISGRKEATSLDLIDTLYSDLPEPEARAALKQLTYLLRTQFGTTVIVSTPGGYALGTVESDIEIFLAQQTSDLWRGAYLKSFSNGWLPSVREALVHALRNNVEVLAKTDSNQALRLGKILLEMEPYDLDVLELTLQACISNQENPNSLYLEMREKLLEVGEHLPDSALGFLREREIVI